MPNPPASTTAFGRPLHVSRAGWYGGAAIVVVLVTVMLGLSNWQYTRAKPHVDLAALAAARAVAAVPASDVLAGTTELTADMVSRRVEIDGRYLPGKQWLVPTKNTDGAPGFIVVNAFEPDRSGQQSELATTILVARGWVADGDQAGTAPLSDVSLTAWIGAPDAVSSTLSSSLPAGQLPEIAPARIAAELPPPVLDGYLGVVTSTPTTSLAPPPEPMTAARGSWSILNLGYAIQWLLFAGALVVAWALQIRRARREPAQQNGTPADADVPSDQTVGSR